MPVGLPFFGKCPASDDQILVGNVCSAGFPTQQHDRFCKFTRVNGASTVHAAPVMLV